MRRAAASVTGRYPFDIKLVSLPMKFAIDDELIRRLRRRRDDRRVEIEDRAEYRATFSAKARNWFRRKFRNHDPKAIAQVMADDFLAGMDELQQETEAQYDAFLIDPGMGPMTYLTADGRVLLDFRSWDGDEVREATEDEAIMALVVGAKKTGVPQLLDLIPPSPNGGSECPMCHGTRWAEPVPNFGSTTVCITCSGRGWTAASATRETS